MTTVSPVFLTADEWDELAKLAQVKERSSIPTILQTVFETPRRTAAALQVIAGELNLDLTSEAAATTCGRIFAALKHIVSESVYRNAQGAELLAWFPDSFHAQLAKLLASLITRMLPQWRSKQLERQVGLPRLRGIDWRIDIKTASEINQQMSVPALIVQLAVDKPDADAAADEPQQQLVHFELTAATLDSMLEGLTKIRTQLGTIAGSAQPDAAAAASSS